MLLRDSDTVSLIIVSERRNVSSFLFLEMEISLYLTSEFNEVQNLRRSTSFEFGWKGNFAWQNSEAVPCNR